MPAIAAGLGSGFGVMACSQGAEKYSWALPAGLWGDPWTSIALPPG